MSDDERPAMRLAPILQAALYGSLSGAMNNFGDQTSQGRTPPLTWTPLLSDDRYRRDGGLLRGHANDEDYDDHEAIAVLAPWVELLDLAPAPDLEPGIVRFSAALAAGTSRSGASPSDRQASAAPRSGFVPRLIWSATRSCCAQSTGRVARSRIELFGDRERPFIGNLRCCHSLHHLFGAHRSGRRGL